MAKPRRVRMGVCPYCNNLTKIDPKRKDDPIGLTTCRQCFGVFQNQHVATWMVERAAKGGV